jgi:hypothetical protein
LIDRLRHFLAMLNRRFPRIDFSPLLEWLRQDARNRYRPWYRYPAPPDPEQGQTGKPTFDQALKKAMRDPATLKRLHRTRRRMTPREGEDSVDPIDTVSKPGKSPRP